MTSHGFVRVAAAVPRVHVADPAANALAVRDLLALAQYQHADVVVFPELCLTGYTCGDLFQQPVLLDAAAAALERLLAENPFAGLAVVGLPVVVDDQIHNTAAVIRGNRLLGVVPKTYLPTYREFYELRWFAPGDRDRRQSIVIAGQETPWGTDLLFEAGELVVGVEICEDLWPPVPPSSLQALAGANLLLNLSASNEVIGKASYRRQLVRTQSGRCAAAYVYASCGVHESSTDVVFGGHCLIAENGSLLAESNRFDRAPALLVQDVDVRRLQYERRMLTSFRDSQAIAREHSWRRVPFELPATERTDLVREIDAHPFVPGGQTELRERCDEIFQIQVAGLAHRLERIGKTKLALGVSGGLDSTLALLVACKALGALAWPRSLLQGFTLPGFGTTQRTRRNALALMKQLGVTAREVDIRAICLEEMRAVGHCPFGIDLAGLGIEELSERLRNLPDHDRADLVFENVQARVRTHLLMNQGFTIGTGDLSELALGWCTYAGDQTSMYNPNVSIPKTLVKFLVAWAAENEFSGPAQETLRDIVATRISPELLPTSATGDIVQETESVVGPYELHDFFLFHFLRYAAPPRKILYLAERAKFSRDYGPAEIKKWLVTFVKRFFANQFKRSCLPDGPKVGTISLSPRGDWRMPSDADAAAWLADLETALGENP
jgi:NAD+ synthase (glutamine-hydrolysing)